MPHPLTSTLALLAALQKERGEVLLAPTQLEALGIQPFDEQAQETYELLLQAQKEHPAFWSLLPERFFDAFALRNNEAFRHSQKSEAMVEWYLYNLEQPVHQMALNDLTNGAPFSPAQTSALVHFVAALAFLSQLRDLGVMVYAKAEMATLDIDRMRNAATAYLAREKLFLGLADETLKNVMDEAMGAPIAAIGLMDQILRRTRDGHAKDVLAELSPSTWAETLSAEITALHTALQKTVRTMTNTPVSTPTGSPQALDRDIEFLLPAIGALPLFRGLPETTLRSLLKGARLIDLKKNDLVLTQGEPLTRFFVLMEGWVKVFKSNDEGQESILSILGKREGILDAGSGTAAGALSAVSAKTVSKVKLLSIPISVLRDHTSRNRELAQNLLAATQNRLNRLITQYEQLTLRSAKQRVGWFLANLYIETGLEGKPIAFPIDKALIAAYLNIKPETFSRILQQFKGEGFMIDKHHITLPHKHALCAYCDSEMALRCCHAESANCAPLKATRKQSAK